MISAFDSVTRFANLDYDDGYENDGEVGLTPYHSTLDGRIGALTAQASQRIKKYKSRPRNTLQMPVTRDYALYAAHRKIVHDNND